jgi:hypothetical protein
MEHKGAQPATARRRVRGCFLGTISDSMASRTFPTQCHRVGDAGISAIVLAFLIFLYFDSFDFRRRHWTNDILELSAWA